MLREGMVQTEEQLREFNRTILRLGEKLHIPVCATGDVHFMDPEDEIYRRILQAGQGFADADQQAPLYLRTTEEMLAEFDYLGQEKAREVVIENPGRSADMVETIRPIPEGTFPPPYRRGGRSSSGHLLGPRQGAVWGSDAGNRLRPAGPGADVDRQARLRRPVYDRTEAGAELGRERVFGRLPRLRRLLLRRVYGGDLGGQSPGASLSLQKVPLFEFFTDGSVGSGFDLPDKTCPVCGEPLFRDGHEIPFETFLGFDGDKAPIST